MSVRKFRSVEEMPGVRPLPPLDPENLRIACELTELAYALHPWHFEPGVKKFRSIEEMNRHQEERERRQVRRPAPGDPKTVLLEMPDVGDDEDFERMRDRGRQTDS